MVDVATRGELSGFLLGSGFLLWLGLLVVRHGAARVGAVLMGAL
jgi:hypothetical protein